MASVNRVILVGHAGRDPETRYFPDGSAVAQVSLATNETWKDRNGERQERTEWHQLAFFGRLAEIVSERVKKGDLLYVEGRIRTRKWQDRNGQDRYATEIVADGLRMLSGRLRAEGYAPPAGEAKEPPAAAPAPQEGVEGLEDDLPF